MKTIKIPYSKKFEEQQREAYWKYSHRSFKYPSNATSFSSLDFHNKEGKKSTFEPSDSGQGEELIYQEVELELFINDLSPSEKEAVRLRAKDYTKEQIVKELSKSEKAVKQLLFRGYKKVKQSLGKKK